MVRLLRINGENKIKTIIVQSIVLFFDKCYYKKTKVFIWLRHVSLKGKVYVKYTKAEVDIIKLDNIDIVTYSGCDDGVWYNDAPPAVYEGCSGKVNGNGFISACGKIDSSHWTKKCQKSNFNVV